MLTRRHLLFVAAGGALEAQQKMFGNAEAYERFMGRWSRLVAPLLVNFAGVPESGAVLDVGSGTGALAFEIASGRPGVRVTGIDPSEAHGVNLFLMASGSNGH